MSDMNTTRHAALTLGALLLLAACSRQEAPPEPVRAVKLMTVTASAVTRENTYAGEVRARVESRLGFRVGGKLVARPVELGQRVAAGQVLAQLDASDLALASQAAQAQVSAAQTQRDLAAADLKRFQDLRNQGFVSSAEIDRRQAALQAAEASLRQAQAQAGVQGNQAGYTRLLADAAGVVVGVEAEVGQVVAAGTPVVRVARDGARDAVFSVPEDRLTTLRPGASAQVRLWSADGTTTPMVATVREVAASADPLTRTFQAKLSLPADAQVPLGATANVTLGSGVPGAEASAVRLPTSALMRGSTEAVSGATGNGGTQVWVFDQANGTVQPRSVVVAGAQGNEVVLASGLKPGEQIVAAGVHVLSPGQKVVPFVSHARQ